MKNVFYFSHLNIVGGIEQFFSYLSEKYKDWDITIIYKTGDKKQIQRLLKNVRVIKFTGQQIICEKAFFCFNTDIRSYIKAKQYCLILHGDYRAMVEQKQLSNSCYIFQEDFDKYYGVSQIVCDSWTELTGKKCELLYNPIIQRTKKKFLRFVYCGRTTSEKGIDLLKKFIDALNEKNVDYLLYMYTPEKVIDDSHIIYLNTRLDASQFLNKDNFDFIIIPSKNEGYCYSLIEALINGLPAIATPCPVFKELGLNDKNSITLDFNGDNIYNVIDKCFTDTFNFTYTPKKDNWDKVLCPGKTNYKYEDVKVKALITYRDLDLDRKIFVGDTFNAPLERAQTLIEKGYVKLDKE